MTLNSFFFSKFVSVNARWEPVCICVCVDRGICTWQGSLIRAVPYNNEQHQSPSLTNSCSLVLISPPLNNSLLSKLSPSHRSIIATNFLFLSEQLAVRNASASFFWVQNPMHTMGFFSSSRKTTELESDNYHVMTAMIETAGGPVVGGGMGEKSVVKVIRSRFVSFAFFF